MREKKSVNVRVGTNIKAAREEAGYTQEELSEMLGITPNHLSAIERGYSGASLEVIEKVCARLDISADYLFFGRSRVDTATEELVRKLEKMEPEQRLRFYGALSAVLDLA